MANLQIKLDITLRSAREQIAARDKRIEDIEQEKWIKAKNEVVEIAEGSYDRLTERGGYGIAR